MMNIALVFYNGCKFLSLKHCDLLYEIYCKKILLELETSNFNSMLATGCALSCNKNCIFSFSAGTVPLTLVINWVAWLSVKFLRNILRIYNDIKFILALSSIRHSASNKDRSILYYPIKNYRGLSPNYREKRWAYVHFIGGAANYPIIYP